MSRKPDYQWALQCWREMMAKYEAGPPTAGADSEPGQTPESVRLLLADARQALYDAVKDGDARELRCAGGNAFQVMGLAIDALREAGQS